MKTLEPIVLRPQGRSAYLGAVLAVDILSWAAIVFATLRWRGVDGPSVLLLVLGLLLLWRISRAGTELTPAGVRILRLFGSERILWTEIKDINISGSWTGRQAFLVLRNGKVVKLPAPGEWWPAKSGGFDDQAALLRQWWAQHSG